jgi:hypothetical protein
MAISTFQMARSSVLVMLYSGTRKYITQICAGISKQSMGGLEPSGNRIVVPAARQATRPEGIGSLESILGLLESLKIRALYEINQRLKSIGSKILKEIILHIFLKKF